MLTVALFFLCLFLIALTGFTVIMSIVRLEELKAFRRNQKSLVDSGNLNPLGSLMAQTFGDDDESI